MSLSLLFKDELTGFYKSKVMLFLWVGLPVISLLLYALSPSTGDVPASVFIALIVSSVGGALASIMLVVTIVNEKERRVYDLFVIRPIKRWHIIVSKFLAVFLCLVIAGMVSILAGVLVDIAVHGAISDSIIQGLGDSIIITFCMIGIACSASVLIGVVSPSILIGVIAVLYGANQLAALVVLPTFLANSPIYVAVMISAVITSVLLGLAVYLFNKKQL
jgi:ABC-2 type transport system permease protein